MRLKVQLKPYAFPLFTPPDERAAGTRRVLDLLAEMFPDADIEVREPSRACGVADMFDAFAHGMRDEVLLDIEAEEGFLPGEAARVLDAALVVTTIPLVRRQLAEAAAGKREAK